MIKFVNREQLYREVWSTPLTKISPLYGLTTYEMKKLCDTFLIPLPRVGHWSKVAFGKTVEIPPLPIYDRCKLKVKKSRFGKEESRTKISEKIEKKITPNIELKKNLLKPHPITAKTRDGLKKSRTDEYGMKKLWKEGFDLRVSKANEKRALLIIDTLCKWFEKNGMKIYQPFSESTVTKVVIYNQEIRIRIEEKSKLTAKVFKERWGNYNYYDREYTPTEQLSLIIDNYCWGCSIRKVWSDGKTSKVEDKLSEFVATIFKHAEWKKQREIRLQLEDLEREKQRQVQRYNEVCEKREKQMLDDLKKQSKDLMESKDIKAYIDEVKSFAREQYKDCSYPIELTDWINWAENYAAELNPLSKGLPTYQKATEIVKLEEIE